MSAAVPLDTATVPFAALEHACEIADSASFENVSPVLNTPTRLGGASAMRNRACTRYRRRCQPMIQIIIVCASPLTQPNPGVEDSSLSGASHRAAAGRGPLDCLSFLLGQRRRLSPP